MHGSAGPVSPAPNSRGGIGRAPPSPVVPPYALSSPISSPAPAAHAATAPSLAPSAAGGASARHDAGAHNAGKFAASPVEDKIVLGSAAAEEANPRFRPTMEDCYSIHVEKETAFFGVYDGHGGVLVAQFAQQRLYDNLKSQLSTSARPVPEMLEHAYLATDAQIAKMGSPACCGSTAVTVLVRREGNVRKIYAANAGDARAVLCRLNASNGSLIETVSLSVDHKPTDAAERSRILAAGGTVFRGRVMGVLAVSRALGDHSLKPMVSAAPYLAQSEIGVKERAILILFCDGVSNVMTDKELAEYTVNLHNSLSPQGIPGVKLPSASYSFTMPPAAGSPAAPRSSNSVMSLGRVGSLNNRGVGKPGSNPDKPAQPADGPECAQVLANSIIAEAMRRGTRDNVTVIAVLL